MFLRSFFASFILMMAYGHEETKPSPVDILKLRHLLIENYNGPLKYDTLELHQNVEDLHLSSSNFTPFNTSFLLAVPNLKRLLMWKNVLEPVDYDINGCCKKTRELELTHMPVGDLQQVEINMIKQMESLENLVIQNGKFSSITKDMLMSPELLSLTVIGCELATIEEGAFRRLTKLKTLDLKYNSLKEIIKVVLEPLTNVTVIDLKGNNLEKLNTDQFPYLPQLETVNLAYNPIMHVNLEGIKKVAPKLKTIDITGSPIEAEESGSVKLINRVPQRQGRK